MRRGIREKNDQGKKGERWRGRWKRHWRWIINEKWDKGEKGSRNGICNPLTTNNITKTRHKTKRTNFKP